VLDDPGVVLERALPRLRRQVALAGLTERDPRSLRLLGLDLEQLRRERLLGVLLGRRVNSRAGKTRKPPTVIAIATGFGRTCRSAFGEVREVTGEVSISIRTERSAADFTQEIGLLAVLRDREPACG